MTTTNVSNIDIATLLKIVSTKGVYNNLSTASAIWKYFLRLRQDPNGGREIRGSLRTSYGAPSFQSVPSGNEGDYPEGIRGEYPEFIAHMKDHALTISLPRSVLNKQGSDLLAYENVITEEMDGKVIVAARVLSAQMMGDGSGAIGKAAALAVSGGKLLVTLSTLSSDAGRSHIGWFEDKDYVKFADPDGTIKVKINGGASADIAYWRVDTVDVEADQVLLAPFDATGTVITVTSVSGGADPEAADYIYRRGTTPTDLTAIGSSDWEGLSEVLVGLEALAANSASVKVHGITRTGTTSGSRSDIGGASLDSTHFQRVLSQAKRRCGKGRYKYREAFMHDTALDALIESRESDRRFTTMEDGKRGTKVMGYQHGKDFVEFSDDEFVQKSRIWMPPESKDVLVFHGTDMELVEVNSGQKFHLANAASGNGHARRQSAYMEGQSVVICRHPAAIAVIEGFTIAT